MAEASGACSHWEIYDAYVADQKLQRQQVRLSWWGVVIDWWMLLGELVQRAESRAYLRPLEESLKGTGQFGISTELKKFLVQEGGDCRAGGGTRKGWGGGGGGGVPVVS